MHPSLTRALRLVGLLETGRDIETRIRMGQERALPDAVILGAQKCGTSSLHNYLTQHPQVIAPLRKEVHYFDLNYGRGERWYRAHFGLAGEPGLNLDSSPYYLFHPCVPKRMHDLLPEARLIVLLRDPVRRAYSHYRHEFDKGREKLSFEAAIDAEPARVEEAGRRLGAGEISRSREHQFHSYLARGRYAEQLERWLEFYPRGRLLVLRFEDLVRQPLEVLNETLAFLGLAPMDSARLEPRNTRKYPPMAAATAERLSEYYAADNVRLEQLLGRPMAWS
ncbi:MAG TPA: sulfotransferase [Steroidobacteraceae bacterium]|nr:sulfotransferase [Steroidobacteraceae bacterium]